MPSSWQRERRIQPLLGVSGALSPHLIQISLLLTPPPAGQRAALSGTFGAIAADSWAPRRLGLPLVIRAFMEQCFRARPGPWFDLMIHATTHNNDKFSTPAGTVMASALLTHGRYRIAAHPRALPSGRFAAHVHITSGHGSASTTRAMRFVDDFATPAAAAHYAQAQGLDWAAARTNPTRIQAI